VGWAKADRQGRLPHGQATDRVVGSSMVIVIRNSRRPLSSRRRVYPPMRLDQITPQGKTKGTLRVVIETTRGSRNKFSFEPEEQIFMLKKVLPEGHVFPFDFGFIPQTKGGDGDPLDVLVMMDEPAFTGAVVECRLIGVLQAKQTEDGKTERNDRYIAVAERSVNFQRYKDVSDLTAEMKEQIEHFFVSYNEMAEKKFKPLKWLGAAAARKTITFEPAE
jgi:inorganic pyrophosphatase